MNLGWDGSPSEEFTGDRPKGLFGGGKAVRNIGLSTSILGKERAKSNNATAGLVRKSPLVKKNNSNRRDRIVARIDVEVKKNLKGGRFPLKLSLVDDGTEVVDHALHVEDRLAKKINVVSVGDMRD